MKQAYSKTRQRRHIRKTVDASLDLPFNVVSDDETVSVVAQKVLEDVRQETTVAEKSKSFGKVPDYVLDYLAEFKNIDRLPPAMMQNVINGLDEPARNYYMELVELMLGEDHNLSHKDAEKTALKLALKHGKSSGEYSDCQDA